MISYARMLEKLKFPEDVSQPKPESYPFDGPWDASTIKQQQKYVGCW